MSVFGNSFGKRRQTKHVREVRTSPVGTEDPQISHVTQTDHCHVDGFLSVAPRDSGRDGPLVWRRRGTDFSATEVFLMIPFASL